MKKNAIKAPVLLIHNASLDGKPDSWNVSKLVGASYVAVAQFGADAVAAKACAVALMKEVGA